MKEYFEALHLVYFKSKTSLSQEPNKNFNFFLFSVFIQPKCHELQGFLLNLASLNKKRENKRN